MNSREAMQRLADFFAPHVQELLADYGEFHTMAAYIDRENVPTLVIPDIDHDFPSSDELQAALQNSLERAIQANQVQALGLCRMVGLKGQDGQGIDAVSMELETEEGLALQILKPFQMSAGKLSIGEPQYRQVSPRFYIAR